MSYLVFVLSTMVILVALATLLHLQFGLTGIVNFGLVGFWGVGLYVFGILMVNGGLPFIAALILTTLVVGVLGLIVGWIVLDLDEQAVLVATLSFATIAAYLVTTEKWLTKGVVGFGTIPFPFDLGPWTETAFLVLLAVLAGLLVAYARRVRSQPYGRLLVGIRDNEGLARSLGKPTFRRKLVLFTVTSALMGTCGAFSASLSHFLVPYMLGPTLTFSTWIALILGGKRHWAGGLVGAVVIVGLFDVLIETYAPLPPDFVAQVPNIKYMLYGLLLVLVILFRPQGLLGLHEPRRPKHEPRRPKGETARG
jgi:branched-chain amino acid transport system permease protein